MNMMMYDIISLPVVHQVRHYFNTIYTHTVLPSPNAVSAYNRHIIRQLQPSHIAEALITWIAADDYFIADR